LIPASRPDTHFEGGVCSACHAYNLRPKIDWEARKRQLLDLLERHKGRCIVPSSGGKDSTAQVMMLKELGARPTVVTATTCHLTPMGRHNIDNLARHADAIEVTPNRTTRATLNRLGLEMVGDISWPEHVAIFSIPIRMAARLNTPLIFYGENPQNQYGGPPGSAEAQIMTARWVSEFGGFNGLRVSDIEVMGYDMTAYKPPDDWQAAKIEAHFLGQYLPWDSHQNAARAARAGMRYEPPCAANWWSWENQDNAQTGIHDFLMFRKFGYGRGCAQISVDIRAGLISRADAKAWLKDHDGRYPSTYMGIALDDILEPIGVTSRQFHDIVGMFTNPELFKDGLLIEEAA